MAELDVLSTIPLPISPNHCQNCSGPAINGQNLDVNGSFLSELINSLNRLKAEADKFNFDNGKRVPVDGNILPTESKGNTNEIPEQILHSALNQPPSIYTGNQFSKEILHQFASNDLSNYFTESSNYSETGNITTEKNGQPGLSAIPPTIEVKPLSKPSAQILLQDFQSQGGIELYVQQNSVPKHVLSPSENLVKPTQINGPIIENLSHITEKLSLPDNKLSPDNLNKLQEIQNAAPQRDFEAIKQSSPQFEQKLVVDNDVTRLFSSALRSDSALQNANINPHLNLNVSQTVAQTSAPVEAPHTLNIKPNANFYNDAPVNSVEHTLVQNIKWIIGNKHQNANINVYPESLGQVNVSISLEDSKITINFLVNSLASKEAIEANLSSLRDQLNENGINLKDVNVNSRSSNESDDGTSFSKEKFVNPDNYKEHNPSYTATIEDEHNISNQSRVYTSSPYLIDAFV